MCDVPEGRQEGKTNSHVAHSVWKQAWCWGVLAPLEDVLFALVARLDVHVEQEVLATGQVSHVP